MFITTTYIKRGLFFQNPVYKHRFDTYEENSKPGAEDALVGNYNFWGIVHRVLNSKEKLLGILNMLAEGDLASYSLRSLRSPIYFERCYRELTYVDRNIYVESKGWNYTDEAVGGACEKEVTVIKDFKGITLFSGRTDRNGNYNLTYRHVVEKSIKNNSYDFEIN